ncbi:ABC transporter permease [Nocardia aurantia]|uniref:Glutathione transport system permease protein GsiC n=1 Tax=Nocardia aurantia TaxID=2585199 RepID=A0A7K0DRR8_9NOCA|nr:ABC transporter permease [Nocardia aurantia]MQY28431.1 Glutathione transport system permease protein GsiC [Nocardia aurantia]
MSRIPEPLRWLAGRVASAVLVIWAAATLTFAGLQAIPGDPARAVAGGVAATGSPQVLAQIRREYGFDAPVYVQYGRYLGRLLHGDLGTSYQLHRPVRSVIAEQLWPTTTLAVGGLLLGLALSVTVAVTTAQRRRARAVARTAEFAALSMPTYWVGFVLLALFSFHWRWFPVIGEPGLRGSVLPWLTLAVAVAGVLSQVTRDGLEEALDQPFALTVRARGASEPRVRLRHALRHAAAPVLTLSGWMLGNLLGGVVVVETVFARQGVGQVLVTAVRGRDYPVVTGIVVLTAATFALIAIVLDQLYRILDPRIRAAVR